MISSGQIDMFITESLGGDEPTSADIHAGRVHPDCKGSYDAGLWYESPDCQCPFCQARREVVTTTDKTSAIEPLRTFSTGATRSSLGDKLRYEGFLSPYVLERFAEYMHKHRICEDGSLREPDNWQKGIPDEAYMDSLIRHVMDVWQRWRGTEDDDPQVREEWEEALCAVLFNTMGLILNSLEEKWDS